MLVIDESRVTQDADWRAWDWHVVAMLLDTLLPSPAVLEHVLRHSVFMQRLGRVFLMGEAGLELPSEAQWDRYQKSLFEESTSGGLFGLFSSGRSRSKSTATSAARPSSVATMAAGGRPVVRATSDSAPSGDDRGAAQIARVAWTPAGLRFARCARHWLVLLIHHPKGRELLLDTDAGARAAATAPEARPGDVLRELLLGLLRQSLPTGSSNPWHVLAGDPDKKELAANHAAAACPAGPPTVSKVDFASCGLIRWRFERCLARELVTGLLGALTASEDGRAVLLELGRQDWGRNARIGAGAGSVSTLAARRSTAAASATEQAGSPSNASEGLRGTGRRGSVEMDERVAKGAAGSPGDDSGSLSRPKPRGASRPGRSSITFGNREPDAVGALSEWMMQLGRAIKPKRDSSSHKSMIAAGTPLAHGRPLSARQGSSSNGGGGRSNASHIPRAVLLPGGVTRAPPGSILLGIQAVFGHWATPALAATLAYSLKRADETHPIGGLVRMGLN